MLNSEEETAVNIPEVRFYNQRTRTTWISLQ
uniref:Uncharacterized protein n=1 Tax=Anguilla anguilla TaxID=7936 RepID=A0A0E9UHU2_ANGAN